MPATAAARLKEIRVFALSLPGTQPKSPWPGHDDVAVNGESSPFRNHSWSNASRTLAALTPSSSAA